MKVLVTGANGFLGANIIRELNRRKIPAKAFIRESADKKSLEGLNYEVFNGNITRQQDVIKASQDCDYIVHAAANTGPAPTNYKHYQSVNVEGTRNVIEAAKNTGVKRLVFVSTANTIGFGDQETPGTEDVLFSHEFSHSGYATSKLMAEKMIQNAVIEDQLNAIILNPTFMIGPSDAKPSSCMILLNIFNRPIVVMPPGGKNFIHVKDVAIACCESLTRGQSGDRYLLANKNMSYSDFFKMVNCVTEENQSLIILPKWMLLVCGGLGSLLCMAGINTKLTLLNARLLCLNNYYSGQKAVEVFDLKLKPIDTAVEEALEWFIKNEYLKCLNPVYSV